MGKFFIPTKTAEDWKSLLAEPDEQWKDGSSAKLLAYCWQEANDFTISARKRDGKPLRGISSWK